MALHVSRRALILGAGAGIGLSIQPAFARAVTAPVAFLAVYDGRHFAPALAAEHWPSAIAKLDVQADIGRLWYDVLRERSGAEAIGLSGITTYADYMFLHESWREERRRQGMRAPTRSSVARLDARVLPASGANAVLYKWDIG